MKHFSVADPDPIGNVFLKAFFGKFDEKPSFRFIQYDTEPQPKTCSYCTAQVHSAQCTVVMYTPLKLLVDFLCSGHVAIGLKYESSDPPRSVQNFGPCIQQHVKKMR